MSIERRMLSNINSSQPETWMSVLWEALHCYREECISGQEFDDEWSDLCIIMAWIQEELDEL